MESSRAKERLLRMILKDYPETRLTLSNDPSISVSQRSYHHDVAR
jgi:hypothetical protein